MYMKNSYVTRSMGNNLPRIRRELKGIEFSKEHTEPIIDEMNQKDVKNQKHLSLKQMVVQDSDYPTKKLHSRKLLVVAGVVASVVACVVGSMVIGVAIMVPGKRYFHG